MPYTRWSPNFTAFETYQSEIDTHVDSCPILVIVLRDLEYAVHISHVGEDTGGPHVTVASAGPPSVWVVLPWRAVSHFMSGDLPRTPGLMSPHCWRRAWRRSRGVHLCRRTWAYRCRRLRWRRGIRSRR